MCEVKYSPWTGDVFVVSFEVQIGDVFVVSFEGANCHCLCALSITVSYIFSVNQKGGWSYNHQRLHGSVQTVCLWVQECTFVQEVKKVV